MGLYESNYLKANSPDGKRAVWLKHTRLERVDGPTIGELWVVLYERGHQLGSGAVERWAADPPLPVAVAVSGAHSEQEGAHRRAKPEVLR